jgi:hypothetical protein
LHGDLLMKVLAEAIVLDAWYDQAFMRDDLPESLGDVSFLLVCLWGKFAVRLPVADGCPRGSVANFHSCT